MENKAFEMQKAMILNCIQLGMDRHRAFLLSELSPEETNELNKDKEFEHLIDITLILKEKELLERHREALEISAERGNSKPIEWMLGKLNPDRWAEKKEATIIPGKLVISKDDAKLL